MSQPSLQPGPGSEDWVDSTGNGSPDESARELFAEFTFLLERGDAPSFEQWVSAHPRHDRELRAEHARWLALQPLVAAFAFETSDPSTSSLEETRALVESLRLRKDAADRYQTLGRVGRGGMGVVYKVRDRHLDRVVGMKILRRRSRRAGGTPGSETRSLQRFLEEARIASRLNHPGIVPVHELGCDERGRVYFTMGFVEGQDLGQILRQRARGSGEWTRERVLDILLRVCEAVTHAHDHGVLHRDLKPSNVMVGSLGQAYVTDWGLARLRDAGAGEAARSDAGGDARPIAESDVEEDFLVARTRTGQALGTLAYMSPEQARGEHDRVGPASDVYSLGAVLYEVLSLRRPYAHESERLGARDLLTHVRAHPPEAIERLAPDAPAELCAICRRAMRREPGDRYPSARTLAADLRAYLEGRVVAAHRTDRLERIAKWIRRNRALAGAILGVLVLAVGALAAISWLSADARRRTDQVFRLAVRQDLEALRQGADELWPPYPGRIDEYESWLEAAQVIIKRLELLRATLVEVESRSTLVPFADWIEVHRDYPKVVEFQRAQADRAEVEEYSAREGDEPPPGLEERVAGLERELAAIDRREFTSNSDHWWYDQVTMLMSDIEAFADPGHGCVEGLSAEHGWGVRRRLEFARSLASRDDRAAWSEAIAAVRADPRYRGLELRPQPGLVPLGPDPCSGLMEFAHLPSGGPAVRDPATGCLSIDGRTGLVLVLIPGGTVDLGGQVDPSKPHYDAYAGRMEQPRQRVELDAFFLSKFEMTQGEWQAATGENPSYYGGEAGIHERMGGTGLQPVENVSWDQCDRALRRMGLTIPTEAQWEYACRGGTDTVWYTGDDVASLRGYENLLGEECRGFFNEHSPFEAGFEDGFMVHAPVGSFQANPFGLHDMVGNVSEWCRDRIGSLGTAVRHGDGERLEFSGRSRTAHGSSFYDTASEGRATKRLYRLPTDQDLRLGCRPSRPIE